MINSKSNNQTNLSFHLLILVDADMVIPFSRRCQEPQESARGQAKPKIAMPRQIQRQQRRRRPLHDAQPCPTIPRHILTHPVMSYHTMPHHGIPCHTLPCPRPTLPYPTMPRCALPYPTGEESASTEGIYTAGGGYPSGKRSLSTSCLSRAAKRSSSRGS